MSEKCRKCEYEKKGALDFPCVDCEYSGYGEMDHFKESVNDDCMTDAEIQKGLMGEIERLTKERDSYKAKAEELMGLIESCGKCGYANEEILHIKREAKKIMEGK